MKEESRLLLEKAQRALLAAQRDFDASDADHAVVHAYYACFHAATAVLNEVDQAARTHPGLHRLFYDHLISSGRVRKEMGRVLATLYQDRQEADYAFGRVFEQEEARDAIRTAFGAPMR